jgi:hypothetical protein
MYKKTPQQLKELGELGQQHVKNNYNFDVFKKQWVDLMLRVHEERGSWDNRKKYNNIRTVEL